MKGERLRKLNDAEQQFTGFIMGSQGYDIEGLVISMGLQKEEWKYLKKEFDMDKKLTKNQVDEIEDYFRKQEEKKNGI